MTTIKTLSENMLKLTSSAAAAMKTQQARAEGNFMQVGNKEDPQQNIAEGDRMQQLDETFGK